MFEKEATDGGGGEVLAAAVAQEEKQLTGRDECREEEEEEGEVAVGPSPNMSTAGRVEGNNELAWQLAHA